MVEYQFRPIHFSDIRNKPYLLDLYGIKIKKEKKNEPKNNIWYAIVDFNSSVCGTASNHIRFYNADTGVCALFNFRFMANISH